MTPPPFWKFLENSSISETTGLPYLRTLSAIPAFSCKNKLAKARKTRTSPSMLGLKKFGLGKLWVKKVWANFFSG